MIVEKVSRDDLILYEILRNPVLCMEFIYNIDLDPKYDEPFEFSWYQREVLGDFNSFVSLCQARATGKTVTLTSLFEWILTFKVYPDDYVLYTVPNKVHLEPVFKNLIRHFRTNSFLKQFISKNGGINSSEYTISLLNSAVLLCRIAGQSGNGSNLIGLHTPYITVDEGGYYPHNAFNEMQPSLNTFTPGFREIVAGVPTGLREKNVLYNADMENSNYSKHRISAYMNPRITEDDKTRAIEQYGGEDSDDFVHYFLGQHGKPVFSLFDREMFLVETYPVYNLEIDGIRTENISEYFQKVSAIPGVPDKNSNVLVGIDLGYTEPTAIVILYFDKHERLKFHARIKLTKVSYPIQEKIIDFIDSKFEPGLLGIDKGNAGMSVVQNLWEHKDFIHKNFAERLIPIDFSSWTVMGTNSDGEEIKVKTKPLTVSILQDYSNTHRLVYSSTDPDMITELERMTYTKNPTTGDISYKTLTPKGGQKGEDHFTSALLCATGAYYLVYEFSQNRQQKKKLMLARWVG
jgi:hypothetical protein